MPKQHTAFVCQECGYDSPAYLGKCPECGAWNSFKEIRLGPSSKQQKNVSSRSFLASDIQPEPLNSVAIKPTVRFSTGFVEMDNVLGGGVVPGSAILVAGDPGIGKSTLLLQMCLYLAEEGKKVLYVSGEESKDQVSMRAMRIKGGSTGDENLLLLSLTDTDRIVEVIEEIKPEFVVIDSVQTVESENGGGLSGSVGQVRYATSSFIRVAKDLRIPIMLVGHVTKEGMVAGPMVLSHMVDTVLFLEGEKMTATRILRSLKNRFGPVDEVGIFLMQGEGMVEVKNPEQIFLGESQENVPGSVLVVIMEGSRPFLIEIQALVVYSKFPMPRRVASGIDSRRVELLLAVLQKHARLPLENYDVFVNVAGGLKVSDPAVDLGVCLAVYSSLKNKALNKMVGIAEVGLLGELRKVGGLEKRVREAKKLGLTNIVTAQSAKTLLEVLEAAGYSSGSKQWKTEDERHFKVPSDEE
ncbi:MAG TPA: DNA repair protein RadA [Candidatus Saccharimonadales bacterium]|nr:DNA repair protein RadA [Candidatus Saccharimonadales bacterium]